MSSNNHDGPTPNGGRRPSRGPSPHPIGPNEPQFVHAAPPRPGQRRVSVVDAPVEDSIQLPPREERRKVQDLVSEDVVEKVKVPHLHIEERFEEVERPRREERLIREPRVEVLKRKIQIPKPVKEERVQEMPQMCVIDKVTEKFEEIKKERLIEKPRYIIQERIVPIPKRKTEEVTIKIPKDEFQRVVEPIMHQAAETVKKDGRRRSLGESSGGDDLYDMSAAPGMRGGEDGDEAERVTGHKYRHIPRPVEVPMVNYKPHPIERLVDRNVPVPVEVQVTQEIQVPTLIPKWHETIVPIHVTRLIEKPVPVDAMSSKWVMDLYLDHTTDIDKYCEAKQRGQPLPPLPRGIRPNGNPVLQKMTEDEIRAVGIDMDNVQLRSFDSQGFQEYNPINASMSQDFLTRQRTLAKERRPEDILAGRFTSGGGQVY